MPDQKHQLTKITIPHPHQAYKRGRLFEQLDAGRQHPIIWVSAPPGSGKTTLISSYIEARSLQTLWYQIDSGDRDIASFFHYLALAVKTLVPRYRKILQPLTPEYLPNLIIFTKRFFETLAQCLDIPTVIVLDNYQEVPTEAPLHNILCEASKSLPEGISFIMLSRNDPPASFSRLQLYGSLALINWHDLQLTFEEAQNIALKRSTSTIPIDRLTELHQQTNGWVAGFRLLLDHEIKNSETQIKNYNAQQVLFNYFSEEVFIHWPSNTQIALLRTAALPLITIKQAQQLTGDENIGKILNDLYLRNYFVVQRIDNDICYEYHSLFRDFLLDRAKKTFNPEEWLNLQRQAAALMLQANKIEAAVSLFHITQDWIGLKNAILLEASSLLAAGRHQTLLQWLNWLPKEIFEQSPWLLYWRALAALPFNPIEARSFFEKAYRGFEVKVDVSGLYLAWAGLMDSFFFEWRDFKPADRWIGEFEQLRKHYPEFPSKAVELRTYWSIGTLLHRQPHHPFLRIWSERGWSLWNMADRDLSVLLGGYMIICFLWWGKTTKAKEIIDQLNPWTQSTHISPLVFILWSCAIALYHSVQGEMDSCVKTIEKALNLAEQTGLHAFDFLLSAQVARCSLMAGELQEAESWLSLMAKTMRSHSHIDGAFYHHLQSNAAAQRKNWQQAIEHARTGIAMSIDAGTPFPEAHCHINLARALIEQGDTNEWQKSIKAAEAIGQAIGSKVLEYLCTETTALAAFKEGKEANGLKHLSQALMISREMDGATWLLEGPAVSADLYNRALIADIETEHVKYLIRKRKILPLNPATTAESWPWPVKIFTLGRFEILCDNQPLRSSRKSQHKPLELLKCLCALGGHSVNQDLITEVLWPDAEGDTAEQAFTTTLHRLRKLLQYEQIIRLEDRHLSLNLSQIWTDCITFNRLAHDLDLKNNKASLQYALNHYLGSFLEGETSHWVLNYREQLRTHYKNMVEWLGYLLENEKDWKSSVDCYSRALEKEPLVEFFYYRLMHSYIQLNRPSDALATYHRCRLILLSRLGISPTQETQDLYHQLKNNATSDKV